ncbi:MAG: CDP-alcohol phosphatidyltransferase family protein [Microbacteriaceae bacterium]
MAEASSSVAEQQPSHRVWTIPNLLSFARLALVPVFLWLIVIDQFVWAIVVLAVASLTDALDGWLARKLNQVSTLGILLDPAADRLYIFAALLGLAIRGFIPWWLVLLIVARDLLIVVLGFVLWAAGQMGRRGEKGRFQRGSIPVTRLGKTATFLLLFGLPTILFAAVLPVGFEWVNAVGWVALLSGTALYWAAGLDYAIVTRRRVRNSA